MTWHNNLKMLFARVSKFPLRIDLALEISFQNKIERLVLCEEI